MKTMQIDDRGFVMVFKFKGREYLLIYTKAGCTRGGHSHNSTQINMLLDGVIYWDEKEYSIPIVIKTLPNIFHSMKSVTDSLMIEWKEDVSKT